MADLAELTALTRSLHAADLLELQRHPTSSHSATVALELYAQELGIARPVVTQARRAVSVREQWGEGQR